MHIESSNGYLVATLPNDVGVVWLKGSHTANVYDGWNSTNPIDCFTFAFEKNKIISHGHSRKDSNCTSRTGRNEQEQWKRMEKAGKE